MRWRKNSAPWEHQDDVKLIKIDTTGCGFQGSSRWKRH